MNVQGIAVILSAQATQFKTGMLQAAGATANLTRELRQLAVSAGTATKSLSPLWAAAAKGNQGMRGLSLAMAGVGGAIVGLAALSTRSAITLERNMQNVATIWDESAQRAQGSLLSLGDATAQILDLSKELPQSAQTAAEGLYQVASSGFQGTQAMTVLKASMEAASAGLTNTETAARGITAVLNAYGLGANKATEVSDILFQTVNLGIITFGELSNTLGDFVGLTAQAGVSFQEAASALATMTLAGVTTAEAGTSLNRVMQAFIDPSKAMTALLNDMGYESGFAAIEAEGLHGIVMKLNGSIGQNVEAWSELFPEIRGLRGALALVAADGANYNRVMKAMADENTRVGATKAALKEQAKSTAFQMQLLWNQVSALGTELAQTLLPAIKGITEVFQAWVGVLDAAPGWLKLVGAGALVLTGLVLALGAGFLFLAPKIVAANALLAQNAVMAGIASTAMRLFLLSLGPLGAVFAIATPLLMAFGRQHAQEKENVESFTAALEQETGAVEENIAAVVRKKIVDQDLDELAQKLGISTAELVDAMINGGPALDALRTKLDEMAAAGTGYVQSETGLVEVTTAHADAANDLNDKLGQNSKELRKAKDEHKRKLDLEKETKGVLADVTSQVDANTEAQKINTAALEESKKRRDDMVDSMMKQLDIMDIYNAALGKSTDAEERANDAAKQAEENRGEARRRALDDRLIAEERAMEDQFLVRERAIEDQYRLEEEALDDSRDLIDERHRLAKEALADEAKEMRRQFEDKWEIEEEALNRSITLIEMAYDKRRRAAEKAYEKEREELEWQRDQLFGMEYLAAQQRIDVFDEAHEDQMDQLDLEEDDVIGQKKSEFEERKETEEEALDDLIELRKEKLDETHRVEVDAWEKQKETAKRAHEDRKRAAERAFEDDKEIARRAFEDRKKQLERNLDDLNEKERQRHEKGRAIEREEREPTLAEIQTTLNKRIEKFEGMNTNLAVIATRSGEAINSAMMVEIAKLPPEMIATIAGAGPAAFNGFVEGLQKASTELDPQKIGQPILGLLQRIGEYAGPAFAMGLATRVASDPRAAQILQDELFKLIAPKEVSPGVWATPKPGGGFYPGRMSMVANGGIFRFADGGEYHMAQIAKAGDWRVWAEPETGGEAYIPMGLAKRGRSLNVLQTVADEFGYGLVRMANGGILGGSGSPSGGLSINIPITIDARVAAGVDPDAVGRAIAVHAKRAVDEALDVVGRQVVMKAWRR